MQDHNFGDEDFFERGGPARSFSAAHTFSFDAEIRRYVAA
jgi:hypothetical protein